MDEPQPSTTHTPTADQALANVTRLLHNAEVETDRQLMRNMIDMADTWLSIASLQAARQEG